MGVEPQAPQEAEQIQAPSVGRIVHVRALAGECRAAIVVRVWEPGNWRGAVNLTVFPDWSNDLRSADPNTAGLYWATSAIHESLRPDGVGIGWQHWHWPERV